MMITFTHKNPWFCVGTKDAGVYLDVKDADKNLLFTCNLGVEDAEIIGQNLIDTARSARRITRLQGSRVE